MYKKTDDISSPVIEQLLLERRMPLSEEKEQEVLFSLSRALVEEGRFLLLCTVKEEHAHDSEVSAEEITISPLLMAEDEKYLPVFTKEAFMQEMGMIKEKDQEIFVTDFLDLITFLDGTAHVAASVLNPGRDDLILTKECMVRLLQAFGTETQS